MSSGYFGGERVDLDLEESEQTSRLKSRQNLLEYSSQNRCASCLFGNGRKKYTIGIFFVLVVIIAGVGIGVTVKNEEKKVLVETRLNAKSPKCGPLQLSEKPADKYPKRLLVTFGDDTTMELVKLKTSSEKSLNPPIDFPKDWLGSSGMQLDAENVLVCGGHTRGSLDMDSYCYSLKMNMAGDATYFKNTGEVNLNQKRAYSASVLTNNGWWITGGEIELNEFGESNTQTVTTSSTELLFKNSSNQELTTNAGPNLVEENAHHCAVQLDDTHTLIAGGQGRNPEDAYSFYFAYIYDWSTSTWCSTEPLNLQRSGHACVLLPDTRVMMVGGVYNEGNDTSAEFLDLKTMKWTMKTELPVEAPKPWLVEDDGEVLLLGAGYEGNQIWSFESNSWKDLNRNLTVGRKAGLFLTVNEDRFVENKKETSI